MAVTTSLRNFGVGLVIATSTFARAPAITAIVAYGLVLLFGTLARPIRNSALIVTSQCNDKRQLTIAIVDGPRNRERSRLYYMFHTD